MSEKRFTFEPVSPNYAMIHDNGEPMDTEEVVDLLNVLSDENRRFKEENEQLKKELDNFKPVMFQDRRKGTVILYSKGDIDEEDDEEEMKE